MESFTKALVNSSDTAKVHNAFDKMHLKVKHCTPNTLDSFERVSRVLGEGVRNNVN